MEWMAGMQVVPNSVIYLKTFLCIHFEIKKYNIIFFLLCNNDSLIKFPANHIQQQVEAKYRLQSNFQLHYFSEM